MVNAKTRKACEKQMNAGLTKMPRVGAKMPGGQRFTKTMRNKTMALVKPFMKNARKMCSMTEKQKKKAAKKMFSGMINRL